jgi:fructose-1-phosphate kinase PfkB-like protein
VLAALVPARRTRRRRVAVLSGSLPRGCPASFYADCVRRLRAAGAVVALDASGDAMALGLEAGPDLVKPNAEECAALVGFAPRTPAGFRRATRLLREKAAHAIVSDGARGAWFDGAFVPAPRVEVADATAAGDTLLAEFCFRVFAEGASPEDAARWAVAAGSAACTMPGGAPPPVALVESLFRGRFRRGPRNPA